ncbi:MAG: hypothetical protein K0Q66_1171 [Chitinophagaceae bacterium]|jgi:hypothetical protein|nr:hypothetical protein [Chitinophagaceae bacterium]
MKKYVSAVLAVIILASCSKEVTSAPEAEVTGNIFYRDANVAIADVAGTTVGNGVKLQFNSLYEKNVMKMELLSGPYENMLCFIHEENIAGNSVQKKSYAITEEQANSSTRYYVIKYTLRSGGWVLTPPFKHVK